MFLLKIILSYDDIKEILGFEIEHSFLKYKKELVNYGYYVIKISLKDKKIILQNKIGNSCLLPFIVSYFYILLSFP